MNAELAVIGGVGFSLEGIADEIETPYGRVPVSYTRIRGQRAIFISRHGTGTGHLPPHRVNYRSLILAAKQSGAKNVISTNTVGSMAAHVPGSIFIPTDFVEFTKSRACTLFEEKAVHVDMSEPYCPALCSILAQEARDLGLEVNLGTYVCAEGPHLESPAQIRMMRQFGDAVGMTGYPEVVLAREAGLCYASICIVTNPACGMGSGRLCASEITDLMSKSSESLREIINRAASKIGSKTGCDCSRSLEDASL